MKHIFTFTLVFINSILSYSQPIRTTAYQTRLAGFEYVEIIKGKDDGKLPLLIAFHYSGGNPTETIADYDSLKNPVRIIIPKGNNIKRNGFSYYPSDYYKQDSLRQFSLSETTVDSLANFVGLISTKYNSKPIVSGISQGGDIAFMLATNYPALIKASFPFAAVIHSETSKRVNKGASIEVPIHLYQGEVDKIIDVNLTRKKVLALKGKLNVQLYTYPRLGHDISAEMKTDYSSLMDELLQGDNGTSIKE